MKRFAYVLVIAALVSALAFPAAFAVEQRQIQREDFRYGNPDNTWTSAGGKQGHYLSNQVGFPFAVDVRDHGAVGDGVADDTAAIQAAVTALVVGSTLYFPKGTYVFSDDWTISTDNITIRCDGATLKLSDSFYSTSANSLAVTISGDGFKMIGCTLDGNKANQTIDTIFLRFSGADSAKFLYNKFKDIEYHALYLEDATNFYAEGNDFINCFGQGNMSEVYSSGTNNTGKFSNTHFSRNTSPRTDATNDGQAYYMDGGDWEYSNDTFDNVTYAYDFRKGKHTVNGAIIKGVDTIIAMGMAGGAPEVCASNINATDVYGYTTGSTGIQIYSGRGTLENIKIKKAASATNFTYGISIIGGYIAGSILDLINVLNVEIDGAANSAVLVQGMDNGVILDKLFFRNSATAVRNDTSTRNILVIDPVVDNITTFSNDTGSMQRIYGHDSSFLTLNGGTAAYDNVTSLVVAHGLAVTPTSVTVAPSANVGAVWVTDIDGTNFTVNSGSAVAGASVYWRAQKY